ncbi:uncharacterized protein [Physcomitrium patens]|uniref:Protein FAM136A n=1 Tax=Physcomitrium patens TaxID=3218 RepID=A0A2K1INQ9_PHYPA|nr:protein FAM136A-like [Physcomitrium patens]PNR30919.1 hypothetical protein PHYPA_027235 [Physcomitrium patens]|eukprot:XP_024360441.1 protein FAM136A-like [Physcomitrella patens]
MSESLNRLSQEVNHAVTENLAEVQDYVNITLQKEYYKCGYECFSKDKNQIQRCVERCSLPVERAGAILQNELNRFQERLQRSMMVCRDRVEISGGSVEDDASKMREMEVCMKTSVREQMKNLPKLAEHIKKQIASTDGSRS